MIIIIIIKTTKKLTGRGSMTQTRGPESFRKSVSIYLRSASATTTTQASICNTVDTVKITGSGGGYPLCWPDCKSNASEAGGHAQPAP